jgi:hypothetical protein
MNVSFAFVMCGEHFAKEKPLIFEKIYADFSLLVCVSIKDFFFANFVNL